MIKLLANHDIVYLYRPRGYTSARGKKFQKVYHKLRSKCAHGIWTLVLLMFLRISYNAWAINVCVNTTDDELVSDTNALLLISFIPVHHIELVL